MPRTRTEISKARNRRKMLARYYERRGLYTPSKAAQHAHLAARIEARKRRRADETVSKS